MTAGIEAGQAISRRNANDTCQQCTANRNNQAIAQRFEGTGIIKLAEMIQVELTWKSDRRVVKEVFGRLAVL
jgi:hypothetical protein